MVSCESVNEPPGSRVFVVCGRQIQVPELELVFKQYGDIQYIKTLREKGVAYVKYSKASSAAKAIEELNGTVLNDGAGPSLKVLIAQPPKTRFLQSSQPDDEELKDPDSNPPRSRLFLVVPKSADPQVFKDALSIYSELQYCKTDLISSKGVLFCKFSKASVALQAMEEIQASGMLGGCKVKCMLAQPKLKSLRFCDLKPRDGSDGFQSSGGSPTLSGLANLSIFGNQLSQQYLHQQEILGGSSNDGSVSGQSNGGMVLNEASSRLFVVLHKSICASQLRSLFITIPGFERSDLKLDKTTGLSKGYAYVYYSSRQAAETCMAMFNGIEFPPGSQSRLKVMPADPVRAPSGSSIPQIPSIQSYSSLNSIQNSHAPSTLLAQQAASLPALNSLLYSQQSSIIASTRPPLATSADYPPLRASSDSIPGSSNTSGQTLLGISNSVNEMSKLGSKSGSEQHLLNGWDTVWSCGSDNDDPTHIHFPCVEPTPRQSLDTSIASAYNAPSVGGVSPVQNSPPLGGMSPTLHHYTHYPAVHSPPASVIKSPNDTGVHQASYTGSGEGRMGVVQGDRPAASHSPPKVTVSRPQMSDAALQNLTGLSPRTIGGYVPSQPPQLLSAEDGCLGLSSVVANSQKKAMESYQQQIDALSCVFNAVRGEGLVNGTGYDNGGLNQALQYLQQQQSARGLHGISQLRTQSQMGQSLQNQSLGISQQQASQYHAQLAQINESVELSGCNALSGGVSNTPGGPALLYNLTTGYNPLLYNQYAALGNNSANALQNGLGTVSNTQRQYMDVQSDGVTLGRSQLAAALSSALQT